LSSAIGATMRTVGCTESGTPYIVIDPVARRRKGRA
jgi:hypothetical protein